jgi:hypothetical protein
MESNLLYDTWFLENPRKMIRIFKIHTITPDIICEFNIVRLDEARNFSALSYMWGDKKHTEPITINGHTIRVTVNLCRAIRSVHH